ncbi:GNAT family N-acetyltransferase [Phytomonospora endophytica]|uniref:GNAT superfamily N-acetyltransferase n=1 Tax=Phytomonospora endophytica TaxID=714109 RepID=A0A841FR81_9ACTN|nr:GNAT family N-acetyltransferase [Phytomonospora endophytica]MBB6035059.1 GNAT superfamily N-acetyltransferase [Phytomonospora endophytica]GIG64194.1 N-acetyltransferase [Phytomonospora endophytica]
MIRRAEPADAAALARLRWRFKAEDATPPNRPAAKDPATAERWIAERLARADWIAWVAEEDGEVVAHVFLAIVERVPDPYEPNEPLGYLTNFYTVPEHRGRGHGGRLLAAAREYAAARPLETVIVWPSERSEELYRREGFGTPELLLELVEED